MRLSGLTSLLRQVEFVVNGYTSKLQILDVGINKPFKQYCRERQVEYMVSQNSAIEKPTRQVVAHWALEAWNRITIDTIKNSWRRVGITTSTDSADSADS